jgi:hypothetical protein
MENMSFLRLVREGEKFNVDFKIKSDAFLTKDVASKAELAKDVCAMANNGNVASRIVIGVSDDGKSFSSVRNMNLTDDRLQSFCKEAIYPPPAVRVERVSWNKSRKDIVDKSFVVITIGPNARQAFRLNRDFVEYERHVCLRRNEVWIRRGATTDIATPEEIAQLVKGKPFIHRQKPEINHSYLRLSREKRDETIIGDLTACVEEIGGKVVDNRAVIPIRGQIFVLRFGILASLLGRNSVSTLIHRNWQYEHGMLLVSLGTVSKISMPFFATVSFKEKWGWFADQPMVAMPDRFVSPDDPLEEPSPLVPKNAEAMVLIVVALPQIHDTDGLRNALLGFKEFVGEDEESFNRMQESRKTVNENLRRWKKEGWFKQPTRYVYVLGERTELKRYRIKSLIKDANTILGLSD